MENNNYYPDQNNTQYSAPEYEQPAQSTQYADYSQPQYGAYPPYGSVQAPYATPIKKNTNLAPVLMGVAAFLAALAVGLTGVLQNFFVDIVDVWTAPYASSSLYNFLANSLVLLIVGGLGFACYKNFKGALKFLGCYFIARTVANLFINIISSVHHTVELAKGGYYNYNSGVFVSSVTSVFSLIIIIALSVVLLFYVEKLTAKKEASQNTGLDSPVDMYGNPVIKKDNFITVATLASFLTVFITTVGNIVLNAITLNLITDYDNNAFYLTSNLIANITGVIFCIVIVAIVAGVSYAMTKSVEKAVTVAGIYMVASSVSAIITNLLLFIFCLAFAKIISYSFITTAQMIMSFISIPLIAAAAFLVAKASEDKKPKTFNNPIY